jgi:hypothetical protein
MFVSADRPADFQFERLAGEVDGLGVDVEANQIPSDNEGIDFVLRTAIGGGRPAGSIRVLNFLPIHIAQHVDGDQPEIHRPARRIADANLSGKWRGRPAHVFAACHPFPFPDQKRIRMHLHPQFSQRILQEEFDDKPGRKKLRHRGNLGSCEFAAIPGGGAIGGLQQGRAGRLVDLSEEIIFKKLGFQGGEDRVHRPRLCAGGAHRVSDGVQKGFRSSEMGKQRG